MFDARLLRSTAAQIAEQIQQALIEGRLQPGEKLPRETELASAFGVNRSTVREALKILSFFGLVETAHGPKGGHFVRAAAPEDMSRIISVGVSLMLDLRSVSVAEVTEVREQLEVPACRWAAQRRAEEDLAAIEKAASLSATAAGLKYRWADARFHNAVARASHNRLLEVQVSALYVCLEPFISKLIEIDKKLHTRGARHHQLIYEAIADRDAERAGELMREHLSYLARWSRKHG